MSDVQEPGERESFENFQDHKTGLENKYAVSLNTKNRKDIYIAVIKELKERNLVNKAFYENELEIYSYLPDDNDRLNDFLFMCLNIYLIIFLYCIFTIIVLGKYKQSFNTTLNDL